MRTLVYSTRSYDQYFLEKLNSTHELVFTEKPLNESTSVLAKGYDHVDLVKAKSLGIKLARVSAYSPYAIAEQAVALLMALNRKIVLGQELMAKGDYRLDQLVGFDLKGKTVGIIGTGKIGSAFAKIMNGFGCNLLAYDININMELLGKKILNILL